MKIITSSILVLATFSCYCQREKLKEDSFDPASFREFKIELKTGKTDKLPDLHFRSARFIDGRADTSKLGFVISGENMIYRRFIFPKPASTYLTEKARPLFDEGAPGNESIVFVLKHLWVSQQLIKAEFIKRIINSPIDYLSFCYVNADCYSLHDGRYKLLGNIDSVISMQRWIVRVADDLLKKTLVYLVKTGDSLLVSSAGNKQLIDQEDFSKNIQADFNLPVLNAAEPRKGIFLTYKDFVNNNPSTANFKLTRDKKTELLESPDVGVDVANKAWGFFDGTNLNIHINDNYYRMVRTQNTFEVAGPRHLTKLYGTNEVIINATISTFLSGVLGGPITLMTMGSDAKIMKELVPYQLNIRNGALY